MTSLRDPFDDDKKSRCCNQFSVNDVTFVRHYCWWWCFSAVLYKPNSTFVAGERRWMRSKMKIVFHVLRSRVPCFFSLHNAPMWNSTRCLEQRLLYQHDTIYDSPKTYRFLVEIWSKHRQVCLITLTNRPTLVLLKANRAKWASVLRTMHWYNSCWQEVDIQGSAFHA